MNFLISCQDQHASRNSSSSLQWTDQSSYAICQTRKLLCREAPQVFSFIQTIVATVLSIADNHSQDQVSDCFLSAHLPGGFHPYSGWPACHPQLFQECFCLRVLASLCPFLEMLFPYTFVYIVISSVPNVTFFLLLLITFFNRRRLYPPFLLYFSSQRFSHFDMLCAWLAI